MEKKKKPEVKVFWTGGWDSSFRVAELSRMEVQIRPIYVHGDDRHSEPYERKAMETITRMLKERPETKAEFLPLLDIRVKDIPENKEITKAYNKLHESAGLGTQMEFLARYAWINPGIELGVEKLPPEESHLIAALYESCDVQSGYINGVWETYVNKEKSQKDGALIFGNIYLPILDKTEHDMVELVKEWGYMDIMKHCWFCHQPYQGRPCGMCHPCEVKMNAGMEFLLPEDAQRRFHLWQKYDGKLWYRAYRKFLYTFFWKPDR